MGNKIYKGIQGIQDTVILRKVVGKHVHATIPEGNIWDMINTLFLTTVAVEPTLVAFL